MPLADPPEPLELDPPEPLELLPAPDSEEADPEEDSFLPDPSPSDPPEPPDPPSVPLSLLPESLLPESLLADVEPLPDRESLR